MGRVRISFDFKGIKEAQDAIEEYGRGMKTKIDKASQVAIDAGYQRANIEVPVKTGRLKRSIKKTKNTLTAGGGDVNYASIIEFGSGKREAKPFMQPAIDDAHDAFIKELEKI